MGCEGMTSEVSARAAAIGRGDGEGKRVGLIRGYRQL
jgi:hypothetical protein